MAERMTLDEALAAVNRENARGVEPYFDVLIEHAEATVARLAATESYNGLRALLQQAKQNEWDGAEVGIGLLFVFLSDIYVLSARASVAEAALAHIEAACLEVCPDNTAAAIGEPDPHVGRYMLIGENGSEVIDTDDPAEVVRELFRLWGRVSVSLEDTPAQLAEARREREDLNEEYAQSMKQMEVCLNESRAALAAMRERIANVPRYSIEEGDGTHEWQQVEDEDGDYVHFSDVRAAVEASDAG